MYSLDVNFLKDRKLEANAKTTAVPRPSTPIAWGKQAPILMGLGAGLGLLSLVGLLGLLLNWKIDRTKENLTVLNAEISKLNAKNQQIQDIDSKIKALEAGSEALVTVFNQIKPWSSLLQEFRRQVPVGVSIESIEELAASKEAAAQKPPPTAVRLKGFAPSFQDVNNFLLTLQASEFIDRDKAKIESVQKTEFPAQIEGETGDLEVKLPDVVAYTIYVELSQLPATRLLNPLSRNGAVGLVTRIKTLDQKGLLKP